MACLHGSLTHNECLNPRAGDCGPEAVIQRDNLGPWEKLPAREDSFQIPFADIVGVNLVWFVKSPYEDIACDANYDLASNFKSFFQEFSMASVQGVEGAAHRYNLEFMSWSRLCSCDRRCSPQLLFGLAAHSQAIAFSALVSVSLLDGHLYYRVSSRKP